MFKVTVPATDRSLTFYVQAGDISYAHDMAQMISGLHPDLIDVEQLDAIQARELVGL